MPRLSFSGVTSATSIDLSFSFFPSIPTPPFSFSLSLPPPCFWNQHEERCLCSIRCLLSRFVYGIVADHESFVSPKYPVRSSDLRFIAREKNSTSLATPTVRDISIIRRYLSEIFSQMNNRVHIDPLRVQQSGRGINI